MLDAAGIVLAGGRSTRMGSPKAALDWHGSTLLRRVTGIVARSVAGPVMVVSALGQSLPALAGGVEVVADQREGRGPLQGLAAGLAAIGDRAEVAYVSSTDVPLLHPAFVRARRRRARRRSRDRAPGGRRLPPAALSRVPDHAVARRRGADQRRPYAPGVPVRTVARAVSDRGRPARGRQPLARLDPALASVSNLNEPADYERAHALPAPEIVVESGPGRQTLRAWSLGELAALAGIALDDEHVAVALNGDPVTRDPELPLVAGDSVSLGISPGRARTRTAPSRTGSRASRRGRRVR